MQPSYEKIVYKSSPEYKRQLWDVAFGLQKTDGLTPSTYVRELSEESIAGQLDFPGIYAKLSSYYHGNEDSQRTKEADVVSVRIVELLEKGDFVLRPYVLKSIHRFLFDGVLPQLMKAGEYRTYDIRKDEPVLAGEFVLYTSSSLILDTLDYDFSQEEKRDYSLLNLEERVFAVQSFISGLWQIHPFEEGNTRTIAVFTELYLRSLGVAVDNTPFADNAEYFRDALVLANTSNPTFKNEAPLTAFFSALLGQASPNFISLR